MTFKEKLAMEFPKKIDPYAVGGVWGCPHTYWPGLVKDSDYCDGYRFNRKKCSDCWNREIPEKHIEEKGEIKMATRKTKAELMEEIEAKNAEIRDLKKEMDALERHKQCDEAANELKVVHDSFTNAGFSRDEATTLLLALINKFNT